MDIRIWMQNNLEYRRKKLLRGSMGVTRILDHFYKNIFRMIESMGGWQHCSNVSTSNFLKQILKIYIFFFLWLIYCCESGENVRESSEKWYTTVSCNNRGNYLRAPFCVLGDSFRGGGWGWGGVKNV